MGGLLHLAAWASWGAAQSPPRCNSPPINGQCTNFTLFDVALTCQCPLTVKHILVECADLKDVRNKHFVASFVKYLFANIEAHKIVDFIKETRFYKQL